jgi:MFS family permease
VTDTLMPDALRPMHLGEILDRTVQIYRRQFLLFAGIAAGPSLVVLGCFAAGFLLYLFAHGGGTAANLLLGLGFLALLAVGVPLYIAASAFGFAALSQAAKKRFFGEPVTIRGMYREAWPHGWRYLGLFALEFAILGVAPGTLMFFGLIAYGFFSRAMGGNDAGIGAIFGVLAFFALLMIYELWMLPRLCMSFAASVAEKAGVAESLKRGWTLSRGTRWRILLLFVMGAVCGWMLTWLVTLPVIIAVSLIPGMNSPQHSQMMGSIILFGTYAAGFAVQALIRPVYGIALVLFYYDQRIRNEGYDIEWMMERAGLTANAESVSQPLPNPEILPGAQI